MGFSNAPENLSITTATAIPMRNTIQAAGVGVPGGSRDLLESNVIHGPLPSSDVGIIGFSINSFFRLPQPVAKIVI